MTHQSHQTNGASLEDCHTNFFALTDLCGIKWRKFVNSERPNASSDPLDDPILRSYSRCMQADILCVWRRIQSTKQDNSDLNALGDEVNNTKVHPPLSLAAAKELWIFWYGEEPDLTELVDAELLRVAANQATWNGTWERGLTYECRSLLFKALHNLMERFVLTKDIVRFGKWFVQPCTSNERIFGRSSQHLSFSFTFFVHGDTVCASIDLREHPAVRPLTKEHLSEAAAAFTTVAASSNNSQDQTSPNNSPVVAEASGENATTNPSGSTMPKPRKVILAPFGMAATLTGNSYKANDPMAEKILEDWASFFPLCNKENSDVPPVVEVISGGHKMYHPSIYVLVTDLDDMEEMEAAASQKGSLGTSSSAEAAALTTLSSVNTVDGLSNVRKPLTETISNKLTINTNQTASAKSLAYMVERLKIDPKKVQNHYDALTSNYTCNTTNTHAPPQAATEMPERAWQDCVTNSLHAQYANATISANCNENVSVIGNGGGSGTGAGDCGGEQQADIKPNTLALLQKQQIWDFVDPTQKAPCICTNTKSLTKVTTTATASALPVSSTHMMAGSSASAVRVSHSSSTFKPYHAFGFASSGSSSSSSNSSSSSSVGNSLAHHILVQLSSNSHIHNNQQLPIASGSSSGHINQSCIPSTEMSKVCTKTNTLLRIHRIPPFHKRHLIKSDGKDYWLIGNNSTNSKITISSSCFIDSNQKQQQTNYPRAALYQNSACTSEITRKQRSLAAQHHHAAAASTPGHGTPLQGANGGASSYSRNSVMDTMPVPSVGSPGTPAPSPHPNSTLSQPTSVPPADQLLAMSPRAPTSVSNLQQPPTPIEHLLDKNTPAPTPTDQNDNKSTTASPYVHPTPSVEPPPSVEGIHNTMGGGGPNLNDNMPTSGLGGTNQPASVGRCTPTIQQQQSSSSQQQQHSHQQQQCGTITVKRFDLQPTLPATVIGFSANVVASTGDVKLESSGLQANPTSSSVTSTSHSTTTLNTILPNNLKRNSSTQSSAGNSVHAMHDFLSLYKPPKICVKDIDSFANDDCLKLDVLYDFTVQDAWSFHTIKRFKPNDLSKPCRIIRTKNLYEGHTHIKPLMPSPRSVYGTQLLAVDSVQATQMASVSGADSSNIMADIPAGLVGIASNNQNASRSANDNSVGPLTTGSSSTASNFFEELDIKTEIMSGMASGTSSISPCKDSKSGIGGNLFTVEGLNPSPNDLEQLFETSSNDECSSVQIHTPPDSNNPSNGCAASNATIDDLKRSTNPAILANSNVAITNSTAGAAVMVALQNCNNSSASSTSAVSSLNNSVGNISGGANIIQAEDLTKMFPTPPSHEQHHPNSSPCQMDIHMTDLSVITNLGPNLDSGLGMLKIKQEYSIELGSPIEEPIEDWSYVYRPPQQAKFVGSSKYAPLTNLPSQTMAPLITPPNCVYKPSWQPTRSTHQQPQQQQQLQQHNQSLQQQQNHQQQQPQHQQHQQLHELLSSAPRTPLQQPRTPLGPMSSSPMHNTVPTPLSSGGGGGGSLLLNQLNCPQAALTNTPPAMQQLMQRAGMSPISPASHVPFPHTSPMMHHQQRQTPIHPPPPYEVAVASPALSSASSTAAYINKQYHSQEPPHTPQSVANLHSVGGPPSVSGVHHPTASLGLFSGAVSNTSANAVTRELPEVSSLIVNILLYDTALNVFRDHNFDSSTVCVCNADSQRIGNIRGADSGAYVPLPGTSFNPSPLTSSATTVGNIRALSAFGAVSSGGGGGGIGSALDSPASLAGAGSSSSTTPSTTTPASNGQQHITGYVDDDSVECTCGFSSVINRRLAYGAGLFYEDELEITGIAEDPGRNKKQSLLTLISSFISKSNGSSGNGVMDKAADQLAYSIFNLLLDQCSIIQTSSSAVHRALQRHRRRLAKRNRQPQSVTAIANVLEYMDANDIISLALEQARLAFDSSRMDVMDQQIIAFSHRKSGSQTILALTGRLNVHKWPYIPVGFSRSNKDIVSTMKSIQPMLQNAFHSKSRSAAGAKDATYTVSGPLTWRQFHRLAGRASGQCEPQPIPSVIVGHDKDWISVAPLAIHYWDKFLLEPYSYARDIVYLVIAPENDYVISKTKTYFKELSTTYEMCKLGKHTLMYGWGGMLTVGQRPPTEKPFTTNLDNWLRTMEDTTLAEKLRLYAHAFQHMLVPYLNRIPNDKTLLNPPDVNVHVASHNNTRLSASGNTSSPMAGTITGLEGSDRGDHTSSTPMEHGDLSQHANADTAGNMNDNKGTDVKPDVKPPLVLGDPLGVGETLEEINPPAIVLYVVEPFTYGSDSPELERLACIAILRMYSELLKSIPDSVKANMNIQIISLESILELGRTRNRKRFSDEIKCLALNIFSQCRRHMVHAQAVKSLTGFGTAANIEAFLKSKDEQNRRPYKMYTPPYILAPIHEKNDKTDFSRAASGGMRGSPNEQKYSVMYCNYCMSEDQSWLLATVTDDRGEMLEKVCINIDVPNRTRRRKAPARRIGLSKLMDYILGLISQTTQTWRLVIGRIGRIGHSELKSWSALLSKQNLQKATKQLKDMCKQCQLMYPPSILSACLVTLEPDAKLRVMPDQFTPDERFSQISIQNPLSTPQDVTCTHILVFPTSAVCLSFTRQFQNEPQVDLDNDFLNFEEDENEAFADTDLDDLLIWENRGISDHNSPDRMEDNRSWQSAGGNNFNSAQQQDVEEVGSINQQPLAVGYLVSTAPTGRMPTWFWAACPHLEDVCPVFLKTALHLHVPNIQTTDDILNSTNAHSSATDHPLDSTLTADVLRYVLEGYNALSWLALDSNTHDRLSCLPINVQTLMDLYYLTAAIA
uniref:Mediator of RNA polymerase II transcription subunit 13 n=1 Tax=Glossina brevipalpis TaxID=37001 RepID=A0A1A9W5S5_9MUSC